MTLALLAGLVASASELPGTLQAVVDDAASAQLPTEPLEQKAREGLAKGVPEARVSAVLVDLIGQWHEAEGVLGERARAEDREALVPAAAAALHQGASRDTVVDLARESTPVDALWALTDVLYAGLSPDDAQRLVREALDHREPAVALRELPEAARLLVQTVGPAGAAQLVTIAMAGGSTPLAAVTDGGPGRSEGKADKAGGNGSNGNGGANGNGHGDGGKAGGKAP